MCEKLLLGCAVIRILLFRLWNRILGRQPPAPRPEHSAICIGLTGSGKTTALTVLAGESLAGLSPTNGFNIKTVQLRNCILNVKELGGSEKIRPYWKHYFDGAEAVIFIVDGSSSDEDMETACTEFHAATKSTMLQGLPVLFISSHQDIKGCKPIEEISHLWSLDSSDMLCYNASSKDLKQLQTAFQALGNEILGVLDANQVNIGEPNQV